MLTIPLVFPEGLRLTIDGFRLVYCLLAALLWLYTSLFSFRYFRDEREHLKSYACFILLTFLATEGLFLSADFKTAFVFFEILSLCSFPWVAHERNKEAISAAKTYLAIAILGGLILLMGLWLLNDSAGTLVFSELPQAMTDIPRGRKIAAGICILLGFGAKAGMFPLHVWLPKAHPVAPAPASALLSGMLTKVGVFGILMIVLHVLTDERIFGLILLILAVITMVVGAVLAVFSENLKRTLACSSMSQIGFILTGLAVTVLSRAAGLEHDAVLALTGSMLHMVNHSLLKLLLFLCAGTVAMNLHMLRLDDVQGWGRHKPLLKICFGIGVIGIGGVPGFNGYLSKTLMHEGLTGLIAGAGSLAWLFRITEVLFLFSGGLTFAYMLRLFICLFIEKNLDPERQARYDKKEHYLSPLSAFVLVSCALFLIPMGIPSFAVRLGAKMSALGAVSFEAFGWESIKGALISLATGLIVYFALIRPFLVLKKPAHSGMLDTLNGEGDYYFSLILVWLLSLLGAPARWIWEKAKSDDITLTLPGRFPAAPGKVAGAIDDTVILRGLSEILIYIGILIGRILNASLDAVTLLMRRTVLKEEEIHDERSLLKRGKLRKMGSATSMAMSDILDNFSYAMMMSCLGITLVFVILALVMYFGA